MKKIDWNWVVILLIVLFVGGVIYFSYFDNSNGQVKDVPNNDSVKTYCSGERGGRFCTQNYAPVCGWFNQSIKCLKYPCAATYGNSCEACVDANVEYWTSGVCPN